ncbi:hypothetical protein ACO2JO_00580 [Leptospira interrogans]
MQKLILTSEEEQFLAREGRLTTDAKGERVLAGLALEESIWVIETGRAYAATGKQAFGTKENSDRYWLLLDRHFKTAIEISWSVDELKTGKPTIN